MFPALRILNIPSSRSLKHPREPSPSAIPDQALDTRYEDPLRAPYQSLTVSLAYIPYRTSCAHKQCIHTLFTSQRLRSVPLARNSQADWKSADHAHPRNMTAYDTVFYPPAPFPARRSYDRISRHRRKHLRAAYAQLWNCTVQYDPYRRLLWREPRAT